MITLNLREKIILLQLLYHQQSINPYLAMQEECKNNSWYSTTHTDIPKRKEKIVL